MARIGAEIGGIGLGHPHHRTVEHVVGINQADPVQKGDCLWAMPDATFLDFASRELGTDRP